MTNTSFTTINANTLEEVHMIAGDQRTFIYNSVNTAGSPISIEGKTCSVIIYPFGDVSHITAEISGSVVGNTFSVSFSGSGLSGLYQQVVKIVDGDGTIHKPAQGKIVIFPAPSD